MEAIAIKARFKLLQALFRWAALTPERVAYEFLDSDGRVASLTYSDLLDQSGRLAALLRDSQGSRHPAPVLILLEPGLAYVKAIVACFLAGVPAVPAYPPGRFKADVIIPRLTRIMDDARPATVICHAASVPALERVRGSGFDAELLVLDGHGESIQGPWLEPSWRDLSGPALIQYTSGSTGAPKGVVLYHENLDHNIAAISKCFGLDRDSVGVSWLPPYHDMGLIGGILTPLYAGCRVRLFSPMDFLKNPWLWLRQISETKATVSGGPDFAYELCVRRQVREQDLAQLDLSHWSVAFNGADRVRWQTLHAFATTFAPAGFRRSAFYPCYGLAEATLYVTGGHWDGTVLRGTERTPVEEWARHPSGAVEECGRISCGRPLSDQELVVVDPTSGVPLPEGQEGEIWLHGPSVTRGYWSGTASDTELFATLNGKRYLRTGDLGYLVNGELVVTGRIKDVIVSRGVNYHASDIEEAAVRGEDGVRPVAAAFMVEREPEPAVVLVVEVRPKAASRELAVRMRSRVLQATGLRLNVVVMVPPGRIPRTSSGKVQRRLCRERFEAGEYNSFVVLDDGHTSVTHPQEESATAGDAPDVLVEFVSGVLAGVCGASGCEPDATLFDLGGDSLRAAECAAVLENVLGVPVPVDVVLRCLTPRAIAGYLSARLIEDFGTLEGIERRLAELARSLEIAP